MEKKKLIILTLGLWVMIGQGLRMYTWILPVELMLILYEQPWFAFISLSSIIAFWLTFGLIYEYITRPEIDVK